MPKRKNRLEYDGGLSQSEIIKMAIECFEWPYKKVLSWYNLENKSLNNSRPSELVERGNTDPIVELLQRRATDLKNNKERNKCYHLFNGETMTVKLKACHVRYVSIQEEVENMIKHKDKAIDKMGKRKYNRLLKILKENLK